MKVLVFKDIKNKRWTIWSIDKKTHLGYQNEIVLSDCSFIVQEDKRQKILKSKKRFPHAWVIGTLKKRKPSQLGKKEVYYNPFESSCFLQKKNKKPIEKSSLVFLDEKGNVFAK